MIFSLTDKTHRKTFL